MNKDYEKEIKPSGTLSGSMMVVWTYEDLARIRRFLKYCFKYQ